MKLNQPFWALIDPTGRNVVWGHEDPIIGQSKADVKWRLEFYKRLAIKHGNICNQDASFWRGCQIKRVIVNIYGLK
jgi:hypothetical protein